MTHNSRRWFSSPAATGDAFRAFAAHLLRILVDRGALNRESEAGEAPPPDIETFRAVDAVEVPDEVASHPGMIAPQERQLLYGLSRDHYRGEGIIVDAGVFLGASTIAFSRGLRDNPSISLAEIPQPPIHAFERAIAGPNLERHTERAGLPSVPVGESFETILRQQLEPARDLARLHVGDIRDYSGDDIDGIEICFLDILKTPEIARHAMRMFFPRLLPGAFVIQQDYFFSDLPHIRVFNEALADRLRYLGEVRSSGIFQVMEKITDSELEDALSALESLDRSVRLHRQAEARTVNPARQYMLRLSRGLLYAIGRDAVAAKETLAEADRQFADLARTPMGEYQARMAWRVERLERAIAQAQGLTERKITRERAVAATKHARQQHR